MKNINLKTALMLVVGLSIVIFFVLAEEGGQGSASLLQALEMVPKIVSIDVIFIAAFSTYLWKWRIFKGWLVPFPNLNGTWIGEIQTTWIDPVTGQRPEPIPAILTIKQSFLKASCVMRTGEMSSHSCVAEFILDNENQIKRLCYTYDSNPISTVRDRSPQHCGTTLLDVVEGKEPILKGEYWTGRKTTGHLTVRFFDRKILDHLPDDIGEHPVSRVRGNQS